MHTPGPGPAGRLRVVVVDADDLVRQTVAAMLAIGDRVDVVGIAGQPGPALELIATARPHVVLIDPRLPTIEEGLAFIRLVGGVAPDVRVLAVCSPEFLQRAGEAEGVDGCLRKTFRPDDLTAAIVAAAAH